MIEFKRTREIQKLHSLSGNGKIKVITGLRRCGKSYLLGVLFRQSLNEAGVKNEEIVELNLLKNELWVRTPKALKKEVESRVSSKTKYLFIDEIQLAGDGYSGALISLFEDSRYAGVEFYLTGSNSRVLSTDLIRHFKGKASEVNIRPLTFREIKTEIPSYPFEDYLLYGGIPMVINAETPERKVEELHDLWENVYLAGVNDRFKGRFLSGRVKKEIIQFVLSNLTSPASDRKIAKRIGARLGPSKNSLVEIKAEVMNLLETAVDSFLLIPSKETEACSNELSFLEKPLKYYCSDLGLLRIISSSVTIDGDVLENAVFLELLSRGFEPIGKTIERSDGSPGQIDFVYGKSSHYLQVAHTITETNFDREIGNLQTIDNTLEKGIVYLSSTVSLPKDIRQYPKEAFFLADN